METRVAAIREDVAHRMRSIGNSLQTCYTSLVLHIQLYGTSGLLVWAFANKRVWHMQWRALSLDDEDAIKFKNSVLSESQMIAVTGAIVAQIAITAQALPQLEKAHPGVRGLWILSLYSALIAVYFATVQYQIVGHLVQPEQIRRWINRNSKSNERQETLLPGAASVITLSANQFLLYVSIVSFLVGFGGYLAAVQPEMVLVYKLANAACWGLFGVLAWAETKMYFESSTDTLRKIRDTQYAHHRQQRGEQGTEATGSSSRSGRGNREAGDIEATAAAGIQIPLTDLKRNPRDFTTEAALSTLHRSQQTVVEAGENCMGAAAPRLPSSNNPERATVEPSQGSAKAQSAHLDHGLLIQILQESARLREESAKTDRLVAQYFMQFLNAETR